MLSLDALLADTALQLKLEVPGPAGATRHEVLWLHNTELPDPSPYIRPTELVLTNGLGATQSVPASSSPRCNVPAHRA